MDGLPPRRAGGLQRSTGCALTEAASHPQTQDHEDFLTQLARNMGKLLKGGDPDLNTAAKKVLSDWLRGRLPYFELPSTDGGESGTEPRTTPDVPEGIAVAKQDMRKLEVHVEAAAADVQRKATADDDNVSQDGTPDREEEAEEEDKELDATGGPAAAPLGNAIQWADVFDQLEE